MKNATFTTLALAAMALYGAGQAAAGTLLDLVNPAGQNLTPYALSFTAEAITTDIAFEGYQAPFRLWAYDISLTSGGGNLLGETWTFTPYYPFDPSDAGQFADGDGSGTNALFFANGVGALDKFDQVVDTVPGRTYTVNFLFSNYPLAAGAGNAPSEFIVAADPMPEPRSVILMGIGLLGVGLFARRRGAFASIG
jgi:hypothetical protein